MEVLVQWFSHHLAQFISPEGAVFIISMIPILELRGGLLAASLLKISAAKALPICIVGNIIPIPFILLFIRQIFKWMKKTKTFRGLITKLENMTPLTTVSGIIETHQTVPILSNVLIQSDGSKVSFTGSNLEIQIKTHAELEQEGDPVAFTVSSRKIQDLQIVDYFVTGTSQEVA